jgi:AcrR family transcriptional regulator
MKNIANQKLQQIITTAKSLFWKFGIKRVSIEEICREANVSKMTFYKHFNNKVDLVKFLIDQLVEISIAEYKKIMEQPTSFQDKVKQSIQLKMKQTHDISQEFFEDIHKLADPEILDFFNQKAYQGIQLVINDYIDAQKKGDIRQDIKPEFIHYFLNHIITMAEDENLARLYNSPHELIIELTNFFFYGILPRE